MVNGKKFKFFKAGNEWHNQNNYIYNKGQVFEFKLENEHKSLLVRCSEKSVECHEKWVIDNFLNISWPKFII